MTEGKSPSPKAQVVVPPKAQEAPKEVKEIEKPKVDTKKVDDIVFGTDTNDALTAEGTDPTKTAAKKKKKKKKPVESENPLATDEGEPQVDANHVPAASPEWSLL